MIRIEVDAATAARFASLPPAGLGRAGFPWTPTLDWLLWTHWPAHAHGAVAAGLGCSEGTALKRYRRLAADPDYVRRLAEAAAAAQPDQGE